MNAPSTPEEKFRRAAESENGCPISAGARVAHVQLSFEDGRGVQIDLDGIPREKRPSVIAAIQDLVDHVRSGSEQP